MDPWLPPTFVLLGSYLLGTIPFGLVITRLAGTQDLRSIGSGNIGATNVLRTGRKSLAALTLLCDAGKGLLAVLLARWLAPGLEGMAAIGAFYGHLYPLWLKFHGGKGIATYLGVALALYWPCGLLFAIVWIALTLLTRTSSVGGIGAALAVPIAAIVFERPDLTILFLAFALTVLWTHRANIARLFAGTEPRIGRA